jgi:transposase-like protein
MMPQVRPDLCQRLTTEISEPGDKWYLDVVFLEINGSIHYLWRAVDQDGVVLDIMVQSRRDKRAAKKFFRKLLKRLRYVPRAIVTDKLKSYSAAKAEVMPSVAHHPTEISEQPRGEFASAHQVAGEADETVQVAGPWATFSVGLRHH